MLSVTCPKCSARYSMSEDLYRRKGGGEAVVITCRKCKSEIRFEAPNEATKPSNEVPVRAPIPRPGAPQNPAEELGAFIALSPGFFGGAAAPTPAAPPAVAPRPAAPIEPPDSAEPIASSEMLFSGQPDSAQDDVEPETIPLVLNKTDSLAPAPFEQVTPHKKSLPAPPPAPKREHDHEPEAEQEDEQAPSSGTPTLTALMSESVAPPPKPKKRSDEDFFAGISGPQAVSLAPPTIDVSTLEDPLADVTLDSASEIPSEPAPDSIPVSSAQRHKKKKKHVRAAPRTPQATAPSSVRTSVGATTKPVTRSAPAAAQAAAQPQKSSGMIWLLGLVVLGGVGFFVYRSRGAPPEPAPVAAAPPPAAAAPEPTAPAALTATPPATATEGSLAAPDPGAAPIVNKPAEAALNKPAEEKPAEEKPTEEAASEKPAEEAAAEKPAEEKPAEEKPAEAPTGGAVFDQAAARTALSNSAAQAAGCRKGDDPSGSTVVVVTFAPSGRVTSATVSGPPFAGTATGGCIAAAMRKTQVPPFEGERITVSKTVNIQ